MKQRKFVSNILKYLLVLPLLTLTFCDTREEVYMTDEAMVQGDAKIFQLMAEAVTDKSATSFTKSGTTESTYDDQCTIFNYPISFILHEEHAQETVINSDEELIAFVNSLTSLDYVSFLFPITLIDFDGVETQLYTVEELEGTLQMAVDACNSIDDGSGDDDSTGGTDDTTGGDDGSDGDDSNGGSDDTTGGDDGSDGDDSNGGSDDTTGGDDGSDGDDSNGGSDDNSDGDDNSDDNDSDDEYNWCDKNNKKVSVCHNGQDICISVNALWQHLSQHDDCYLGPCND